MNHSPFCIVLTTTAIKEEAETLSKKIIDEQLAGCVHIKEVDNHYSWEGEYCHEQEFQLIIKTTKAKYQQLEEFITGHHSYDNPEIIQLPITTGSKEYLEWLDDAVS